MTWRVDFPLWRKLLKWTDRARTAIEGVTSVQGPVETVDGKLTLRIPLEAGGAKLARCARGVGNIDAECLNVVIPHAVAEGAGIREGCLVAVDNRWGRFNITLVPETANTVRGDNSN
jgi:hypothetical protein